MNFLNFHKGTNPALKKPSNVPELYAKMFGRFCGVVASACCGTGRPSGLCRQRAGQGAPRVGVWRARPLCRGRARRQLRCDRGRGRTCGSHPSTVYGWQAECNLHVVGEGDAGTPSWRKQVAPRPERRGTVRSHVTTSSAAVRRNGSDVRNGSGV